MHLTWNLNFITCPFQWHLHVIHICNYILHLHSTFNIIINQSSYLGYNKLSTQILAHPEPAESEHPCSLVLSLHDPKPLLNVELQASPNFFSLLCTPSWLTPSSIHGHPNLLLGRPHVLPYSVGVPTSFARKNPLILLLYYTLSTLA